MYLHCNHANGRCGLLGVERFIGKKCGKIAEGIAGKDTLSEGADWGKGKMVISSMSNHSENGTKSSGSKR